MNPCRDLRQALGVYVVGAIDPAERSRLEAHLATCPACRDELAGMAGLPALLGRVSEQQIEHVAGPSEELLDSLLARAAAERPPTLSRFSRRLWMPLSAAAAVVLLAGFLLGGLLMGGGGGPAHPRPSGSVSAPPTVAVEQAAATDPTTHVSALVKMTRQEWGTSLSIRIDNAPGGDRCSLIVWDRAGHRDVAASWQVEAEGYGDYLGSTMIFRDQLKSFQVVTTDGKTLVTVPVVRA